MSLEYYEQDMMRCNRCSYCKWVSHEVMNSPGDSLQDSIK
jgi:hypothetical protein